jgi:hypothetical protein
MRQHLRLASFVIVSTLPGLARAGVTIVVQRADTGPSTVYVEGTQLRADMPVPAAPHANGPPSKGHAAVVLLDAARKRQIMIDETNKTYTEITEEDRKRMRSQMESMRGQMQEQLKSLPPEQRKKMEAALGAMGASSPTPGAHKPSEWKYEALGAKKTVNGFACEMYRVTEDGHAREEVCISPWSAGLVKKDDFVALAKFGEEMMTEMGLDKKAASGSVLGRLNKAPGLPITRVSIDEDGKRSGEEQIKSIKRGSLDASLFAVPAGYTKKDLPLGPGPGAGAGHH